MKYFFERLHAVAVALEAFFSIENAGRSVFKKIRLLAPHCGRTHFEAS